MGCISSKKARSESPEYHYASSSSSANSSRNNGRGRLSSSSLLHARAAFGPLEKIKEEPEEEEGVEDEDKEESIQERHNFANHSENLRALKRGSFHKKSVFSLKFGRLTEGEHVAAGWPAWLSAVAGEAIEGWLPLRSETFKRLEKVSSIFWFCFDFFSLFIPIDTKLKHNDVIRNCDRYMQIE